VCAAVDRDVPLLHRLEQRRLRPRRCPVDLVREHDVGEDRPGDEDLLPGLQHLLADDVRRRRVGRELDALERGAEHVRHRAREQRLRASGRALDEDVPVRECRDEQELDSVILAHDDLAHLGLRGLAQVAHALEVRFVRARPQDAEIVVRHPSPSCVAGSPALEP
jgi:hypothetical protein